MFENDAAAISCRMSPNWLGAKYASYCFTFRKNPEFHRIGAGIHLPSRAPPPHHTTHFAKKMALTSKLATGAQRVIAGTLAAATLYMTGGLVYGYYTLRQQRKVPGIDSMLSDKEANATSTTTK